MLLEQAAQSEHLALLDQRELRVRLERLVQWGGLAGQEVLAGLGALVRRDRVELVILVSD